MPPTTGPSDLRPSKPEEPMMLTYLNMRMQDGGHLLACASLRLCVCVTTHIAFRTTPPKPQPNLHHPSTLPLPHSTHSITTPPTPSPHHPLHDLLNFSLTSPRPDIGAIFRHASHHWSQVPAPPAALKACCAHAQRLTPRQTAASATERQLL